MSLNYPSVGFGSYSGYAAPGIPWVYSASISGVTRIEFPCITQEIYVANKSATTLSVGFSQTAFTSGHSLTIPVSGTLSMTCRCADLYLNGTGAVEVLGSLSVVNRREMPLNLSGSWTGI